MNTIIDMLQQVAAECGGRTAVVDGDRALSYAGLEQRIAALAVELRKKGIGQGDRVALLFPNQVEFVTSFFFHRLFGSHCGPAQQPLSGDRDRQGSPSV